MARTLSPIQTLPTLSLAVRDKDIWTWARKHALDSGLPLPTIVEEALSAMKDAYERGTVRVENT